MCSNIGRCVFRALSRAHFFGGILMKKLCKALIFVFVLVAIFSFAGCDSTSQQTYDIDSYYFDDATFERKVSTNVSFEGNVGTPTSNSYYIKLNSKCSMPLYEYKVISDFYDSSNSRLYRYEQTFKKDLKANENIEIYCEVSFDIYSKVASVATEITGKSYTNPNAGATPIERPIEAISLNYHDQAITVDSTIELKATLSPANTDDTIIWKSSNNNVATVNNGVVKAVGKGNVIITVEAKRGTKYQLVNFKVMPTKKSTDISQCKSISNSSIVTIENKCYNTFLGIPTKSESKTFSGVIYRKMGNTCYFVTGYSNFDKISGYDYQSWSVTDSNGKKYDLSNIQYERDYALGNNFKLAVGKIEANNLSALNVSSRDKFFENERIYIKSGNSFVESKIIETTTGSPVTTELQYQDSLYGSLILDCEFNFIGIGIRKDVFNGDLDFVNSNFIKKFINTCTL